MRIPITKIGMINRKVMPKSMTTAAEAERPRSRPRTRLKMPKVTVTMIAPSMMAVRNGQTIWKAAQMMAREMTLKKMMPARRHCRGGMRGWASWSGRSLIG